MKSLVEKLEALKYGGAGGDYDLGHNDAMDEAAALVREHFSVNRQALLEAVEEAFRPKQPATSSASPLADHFAEDSSKFITQAIRSLAAVAVVAFEQFWGESSSGSTPTPADAEASGAEDAATSSPARITVVTRDMNAYVLLTNLAAKIEYQYVPPSGPIVTRSVPARRKPPYYDPGIRSVQISPDALPDEAMIAITSGAAKPEDHGMRQAYPAKTSWTCPDCCVNPCKCEVFPATKPGTFTTGDLKAESGAVRVCPECNIADCRHIREGWIEYPGTACPVPLDATIHAQLVTGMLVSGAARNMPWFLVSRYRIVREGGEG